MTRLAFSRGLCISACLLAAPSMAFSPVSSVSTPSLTHQTGRKHSSDPTASRPLLKNPTELRMSVVSSTLTRVLAPSHVNGLAGGSLIGLAAGSLLLGTGNIMGASGILHAPQPVWKQAFVASMLVFSSLVAPSTLNTFPISSWMLGLSGLLVGFGTRWGNGCTSGHGICGLARFSQRSLVAVLTFMATGAVVATTTSPVGSIPSSVPRLGTIVTASASVVAAVSVWRAKAKEWSKLAISALSGALFAQGLILGGMVHSAKVRSFLDLSGIASGMWDPTLMFTMMGGLTTSLLAYQMVESDKIVRPLASLTPVQRKTPMTTEEPFVLPDGSNYSDPKIWQGAALFGTGWGLAGICPGPALVAISQGYFWSWWLGFGSGSWLALQVSKKKN